MTATLPTLSRGRVVWTCNGCGEPVKNGTGYIECDDMLATRRETEDARKDAERILSTDLPIAIALADLGPVLAPVPWLAWHGACDPRPDVSGYWIAVERIRTLRHVLHWTAHLGPKGWPSQTNWDDILFRLGEDS
jgi:hypothetical protein